jgi:hypothetical protein
VAIKAGDSDSFWTGADEVTANVVTQFHNAGIEVFAWQYVYSYDHWGVPNVTEADVANRILDIPGIDGLIVDAETEYEGHPTEATQYMQAIRAQHPTSFVAYAPFPIIDYHTSLIDYHASFPYLEFGKYCDAVMPQAYWKDIGVGPVEIVNWMKEQWDKWNSTWQSMGHGDSVKPIIPIGQGYNVSGNEITEFCNAVYANGYDGVSLYRYETMNNEMWSAYADITNPNEVVTNSLIIEWSHWTAA